MTRLVLLVVALLLVVSCEPMNETAQPNYPHYSTVGRHKGLPKVDEKAATTANCKEEDGFQLVEGKCVEKEVEKAPEPPPVATECDYGDQKDCTLQCDRGNPMSCAKLATMHQKGEGGAQKNQTKAAVLYQKACDGGQIESCSILGMMYVNGEGVHEDLVKAAALFKLVCDNPQHDETRVGGCVLLGILYELGGGVRQDYAKAAELYQGGCDLAVYNACYRLGKLYQEGKGVPKDAKKATAFYKKACDGKIKEGCAIIAAQKRAGQAKNWKAMSISEFLKYANTILEVGVAANPTLAIQGIGILPLAMMSQLMSPADRDYAIAEFFVTTYFEEDVVIAADKKFKVSPAFLEAYKRALPIKARMTAACIQDCLASDVRATRDACTARCSK